MKVLSLIGDAKSGCVRLGAQLGECTAVLIARDTPESAALRERARSDGAQQVIQVWDDGLIDLERDPLSRELMQTAVLAALGRKLETRFFIVPETSYGWLGPALAEELELPHVSATLHAELDPQAPPPTSDELSILPNVPGLIVRRRCLQGIQKLRGPAVGVLCLLPRGEDSAAAKADGAVEADKWDLARLGLGQVDLPRPLLRLVVPERRQTLRGRTFDSLLALAERLRQDGLSPFQPPPPIRDIG